MSRIHEALKRAEQERIAAQHVLPNAAHASEVPVSKPATPVTAPLAPPVTVSAAVVAAVEPAVSAPAPVPAAPPVIVSAPVAAAVAPLTASTTEASSFNRAFTVDSLARFAKRNWEPDAKSILFVDCDEDGTVRKQFHALCLRLDQMRRKMRLKKILVTSALPEEGKSFLAANLAQAIVRQCECKALLIDANLQHPRLHTLLGASADPGLSDFLLGASDEFSIVQQGESENLFFIPAGQQGNSAGLVANGRLRTLLQRLEPIFSWIIIDSPAATTTSDVSVLANFCDGVLMVVRSNVTNFEDARKARRKFQGKPVLGLVLNGVDTNSSLMPH